MFEWEYHQVRHGELLCEAERERLLRDIRQARAREHRRRNVMAPMMLAVGRSMVRAGVWLESFGNPATRCADEVG